MFVLGIETSCDETSASVVSEHFRVQSQVVLSQMEHSDFGGVVPEIASRLHSRNIHSVVNKAIQDANLSLLDIDGIAVTYGPGLIGSLVVGLMYAKGLAQSMNIPYIGINHLEGHIFSIFLTYPELKPPILFLLASGGHTEIILMKDFGEYEVLGHTVDDAAGECFDKVAKMLGLPYPGGPYIDKLAKHGDENFVEFPVPQHGNFNFSFSGLKTAVLYYLNKHPKGFVEEHKNDIIASFQKALVEALCDRMRKAIAYTNVKKVAIVGGVSNNSYLREQCSRTLKQTELYFPERIYTTDNAAMIGAAGLLRLKRGERSPLSLAVKPSLYIEEANK